MVKKTITKTLSTKKDLKSKINLPNISVVGLGGSGLNATNYMIKKDVKNVKFIAINTDIQDLNQSKASKKISIGEDLTNGAGAGMNPEIGKKSAVESSDEIAEALKDTQMVFLTGGMGGGTGTGATPVVAQISKDMGILTVAVVTKPFSFEGKKRSEMAEVGIADLAKHVDAYIVIENDKILEASGEDASIEEAFQLSDEVLRQAVEGISELITKPGMINIDYADIKAVLEDSKLSLIGIGSAIGADRAQKAASAAIHSPLIDISTKGARSILFSISTNGDLKMSEISDIANYITEEASTEALIKFGTVKNTKLKKGEIKITVVASNFEDAPFKEDREVSEVKSFGLSMKGIEDSAKEEPDYEYVSLMDWIKDKIPFLRKK
jgi:cell division protein FtsZ